MNIDETLKERGTRYGEFVDHAYVTQRIKEAMATGHNWGGLDDDMRECLEMVAHKLGRILNGDMYYIDSWTDIIGYTRLVEKRLIDEQADESQIMAKAFDEVRTGMAQAKAEKECDCSACQLHRHMKNVLHV